MTGEVELWSCIACGAIGSVADLCTGACDDRRATFVRRHDQDALSDALAGLEHWAAACDAVLRRLAAAPDAGMDAAAAWADVHAAARQALAVRPADPAPGEPLDLWACATCGRIERPQPCLGVCVRVPEAVIPAAEHAGLAARASAARSAADAHAVLLARAAHTTPRPGSEPATLAAFAAQAQAVLEG